MLHFIGKLISASKGRKDTNFYSVFIRFFI